MARLAAVADLSSRVGPVELEQFGAKWVAVRGPSEFDGLMRRKGGLREAGSRRWLIPGGGSIRWCGSFAAPRTRCSGRPA